MEFLLISKHVLSSTFSTDFLGWALSSVSILPFVTTYHKCCWTSTRTFYITFCLWRMYKPLPLCTLGTWWVACGHCRYIIVPLDSSWDWWDYSPCRLHYICSLYWVFTSLSQSIAFIWSWSKTCSAFHNTMPLNCISCTPYQTLVTVTWSTSPLVRLDPRMGTVTPSW